MAGGVLRTLGVLFIVLAIVGILGGAGAAYWGNEEKQKQDQSFGGTGLGADPEKGEQADQAMIIGAIAAGAGAALLGLSIIFFIAAGSRSRKTLLNAMSQAQAPGPAPAPTTARTGMGKGAIAAIAVASLLVVGVLVAVAVNWSPISNGARLGMDDDPSADGPGGTGQALRLHPVFNDNELGDGRYVLGTSPDDAGMVGPHASPVVHTWKLLTPPQANMTFAPGGAFTLHWVITVSVPATVEFVAEVRSADGAVAAEPLSRTATPAAEEAFDVSMPVGLLSSSGSLSLKTQVTVTTGAPAQVLTVALPASYLIVPLE